MCTTCGCGQPEMIKITSMRDMLFPKNMDVHQAPFAPAESNVKTTEASSNNIKRKHIDLNQDILMKNNLLAEHNRRFFEKKKITAFNLVSSPGSGKTALLEKTLGTANIILEDIRNRFYVIEGDQQTTSDAERIMITGVPVTQINTGKGCHLDAQMVADALNDLRPEEHAILFIENIGNLVCPSMFDLGEHERIVIISVTEGEDKPLKYPDMFAGSQLCIINKTDLLPYLKFDLAKLKANALQTNPHLEFLELSCSSGEGLDQWFHWLKAHVGQDQLV